MTLTSLRLQHYTTSQDYVRALAEVTLCAGASLQLLGLLWRTVWRKGLRYAIRSAIRALMLSDTWGLLCVCRLVSFAFCVSSYLAILDDPTAAALRRWLSASSVVGSVTQEFASLAASQLAYQQLCSVCLMLSFCSLFQYLSFSPPHTEHTEHSTEGSQTALERGPLSQHHHQRGPHGGAILRAARSRWLISRVLGHCYGELRRSLLALIAIFITFAVVGVVLFGSDLKEFSTIGDALSSVMGLSLAPAAHSSLAGRLLQDWQPVVRAAAGAHTGSAQGLPS